VTAGVLALPGEAGAASNPSPFPGTAAVNAARAYAKSRAGIVSFAVMDTTGRIRGLNVNRDYVTASVVKAMQLVAYLRKLAAHHQPLTRADKAVLYPMIHVSNNRAATTVFRRIGAAGLYRLAKLAGMTNFSVRFIWADARITPADQVRFFSRLNELTPHRFLDYARFLLRTVVHYQAWGIPEVARPDWRVFFKVGCRRTSRGRLVHQSARLERNGQHIAISVMTDGDPSFPYGVETIRGVTRRLLGIDRAAHIRLHRC
jgi:hypothetical protein